MKEIPLTQGKVALIDNEDFEWLSRYKWFYQKNENDSTGYAVCKLRIKNGEYNRVRMHRMILNITYKDKRKGDHINGNGLDNRRENLRTCNDAQNCFNSKLRKDSMSGFKGVFWDSQSQKWQAQIYAKKKRYFLGRYRKKESAALAYNNAALKYHGEFARLNEIGGLNGNN